MSRSLFFSIFLLLLPCATLSGQSMVTVPYAERDTCTLYMDIYLPSAVSATTSMATTSMAVPSMAVPSTAAPNVALDSKVDPSRPAVLFMFGGGFMEGDKRKGIRKWVKSLTDNGYPVVSIDYRLGLKGAKLNGLGFIKSLDNAIDIAVEDLFSATAFLLEHGREYGVDARNLVISGSSAGAITVLQAEYEICNGSELAKALPYDFNYAGVISFSGAIFDNHNPIRFAKEPCPLLLFHGTDDKLVPYKKIAFCNICFAGTDEVVRVLKKDGWRYTVYRYLDRGHEVSIYQHHCLAQELDFITGKVTGHSDVTADILINDPSAPRTAWGQNSPKALYK